ncbi:hypothetical protein SAY87_032051 [Trapa incisa]|uniref:Uncharacterized protein n=1 Tax=Trapa incisa TaxID=236973 RepID=A0AAN7KS55_9MYRT|nr:hypothetical protein SAY87_032051 [Trapa incisa]
MGPEYSHTMIKVQRGDGSPLSGNEKPHHIISSCIDATMKDTCHGGAEEKASSARHRAERELEARRNQGGSNPCQGGGGARPSVPPPYGGVGPPPSLTIPPPPPPAVMYPPHYGYPPYNPEYGYPQPLYNPLQQPHYYQQMYGPSPSSSSSSPSAFYYGPYSLQAQSPRGTYPVHAAHRFPVPPYLYYPTPPAGVDGALSPYHAPLSPQPPVPPILRHPFSSPTVRGSYCDPNVPNGSRLTEHSSASDPIGDRDCSCYFPRPEHHLDMI